MRKTLFQLRNKRRYIAGNDQARQLEYGQSMGKTLISGDLDADREYISSAYGYSSDLYIREIRLKPNPRLKALLVNIDGMVNDKLVADNIISVISAQQVSTRAKPNYSADKTYTALRTCYLASVQVKEAKYFEELQQCVGYGDMAILVEGVQRALICSVRGYEHRKVEEPATENAIRGPRDGFTEMLRANTSLLRRRINDSHFRVNEITLGKITKTKVAIAYIEGLAQNSLVSEVKKRLNRINIDGILESGYLEEYIADTPYSPFPQVLRTERPDRVAGNLLEGRVAIITDGTPFVLVVPATFQQFLTSPEDYYEGFIVASLLRCLRYSAFLVSIVLPSLYVAVTTFHQELLPTSLILRIAAQREGVPFPAFFEALLMEVAFEVLREAGIRLPRIIGSAISIVGVLVIGQTAVSAGLVSPFMVIVVSFTAIASFATPAFNLGIAARLIRFGIIFFAGSLGIFGIICALSLMFIHLTSLRSFGYPYLSPAAPIVTSNLKDSLVRVPWWAMIERPRLVGKRNIKRQPSGQIPSPPRNEGD